MKICKGRQRKVSHLGYFTEYLLSPQDWSSKGFDETVPYVFIIYRMHRALKVRQSITEVIAIVVQGVTMCWAVPYVLYIISFNFHNHSVRKVLFFFLIPVLQKAKPKLKEGKQIAQSHRINGEVRVWIWAFWFQNKQQQTTVACWPNPAHNLCR